MHNFVSFTLGKAFADIYNVNTHACMNNGLLQFKQIQSFTLSIVHHKTYCVAVLSSQDNKIGHQRVVRMWHFT